MFLQSFLPDLSDRIMIASHCSLFFFRRQQPFTISYINIHSGVSIFKIKFIADIYFKNQFLLFPR